MINKLLKFELIPLTKEEFIYDLFMYFIFYLVFFYFLSKQ